MPLTFIVFIAIGVKKKQVEYRRWSKDMCSYSPLVAYSVKHVANQRMRTQAQGRSLSVFCCRYDEDNAPFPFNPFPCLPLTFWKLSTWNHKHSISKTFQINLKAFKLNPKLSTEVWGFQTVLKKIFNWSPFNWLNLKLSTKVWGFQTRLKYFQ